VNDDPRYTGELVAKVRFI